jgi:hypothetical protein
MSSGQLVPNHHVSVTVGNQSTGVKQTLFFWLMHCATNRKVAGSIPDEVVGVFNLPNPSSRTMALGSTQPLTEESTRNLPGGKGRPARGADNLTTDCLENVGASTSHNPMGLHGLLQG